MVAVDTVTIYKNKTAIKINTFISKTFKIDHTITYQTWIQWPFYSKHGGKTSDCKKIILRNAWIKISGVNCNSVWEGLRKYPIDFIRFIYFCCKNTWFLYVEQDENEYTQKKKIRIVTSVNSFVCKIFWKSSFIDTRARMLKNDSTPTKNIFIQRILQQCNHRVMLLTLNWSKRNTLAPKIRNTDIQKSNEI